MSLYSITYDPKSCSSSSKNPNIIQTTIPSGSVTQVVNNINDISKYGSGELNEWGALNARYRFMY